MDITKIKINNIINIIITIIIIIIINNYNNNNFIIKITIISQENRLFLVMELKIIIINMGILIISINNNMIWAWEVIYKLNLCNICKILMNKWIILITLILIFLIKITINNNSIRIIIFSKRVLIENNNNNNFNN